MTPLPNPTVPLVDGNGRATTFLTGIMGGLGATPPAATEALVNGSGQATVVFRRFLMAAGATVLPNPAVQLTDDKGRPTRVFTAILTGLVQ